MATAPTQRDEPEGDQRDSPGRTGDQDTVGTAPPKGGLAKRDGRVGLVLITPTLVIVLAAVVVPLLWSVLIAFQDLRLIEIGQSGLFDNLTLDNFGRVLGSSDLWSTLATTLFYTAGATVLSIGLGLLAALVVRRPFRGRGLVRAAMLLPYVAPVVAVTFVWQVMLSPEFGIVNEFGTSVLGWDEPIPFLSQAEATWSVFGLDIPIPAALLTVIVFEGWRYFPFAFLFLLARLQAAPADIEEAAAVDGASRLQVFRYIVLPQLMPVIAVLSVLRIIWTFNEFDDIYLLTGGAAGTQVASVRVFELLTVQRSVGGAAAQSVFLAGVLIVLLVIYLRILNRRSSEDSR